MLIDDSKLVRAAGPAIQAVIALNGMPTASAKLNDFKIQSLSLIVHMAPQLCANGSEHFFLNK